MSDLPPDWQGRSSMYFTRRRTLRGFEYRISAMPDVVVRVRTQEQFRRWCGMFLSLMLPPPLRVNAVEMALDEVKQEGTDDDHTR